MNTFSSTETLEQNLIELNDVTRTFQVGKDTIHALRGVTLHLPRGKVLGLAGESGSGKSTLARVLAGITSATKGVYLLENQAVSRANRLTPWFIQRVQMVFQDPTTSLNPRRTIAETLDLPLQMIEKDQLIRQARMQQLLEMVELSPRVAKNYPASLSGGEKQRVAIARALALQPEVLILDEPTSALDVSVQAKIIQLLMELKQELDLTYLFISHDLSLMRNVADETAIMYLGRIVEQGKTSMLFNHPVHPYTRMLLSAIPVVSPDEAALRPPRYPIVGEIPSATKVPSGCAFHTRCPYAIDACKVGNPQLVAVGINHEARCIRAEEIRLPVPTRMDGL